MFTNLRYQDPGQTVIIADRTDGSNSSREISQTQDADLWAAALGGSWGAIADYVPPPPPPMEEVIHTAIALVNRQFGGLRSKYITTIPAQSDIYKAKLDSANEWIADARPEKSIDDPQYALLKAEVGKTAADPDALAALWRQRSIELRAIAAPMEELRLGTIYQIETTTTIEEVDAIMAAFSVQFYGLVQALP